MPMFCRVPQKYLIQNNSGLSVYYWVDSVRLIYPIVHSLLLPVIAMQ